MPENRLISQQEFLMMHQKTLHCACGELKTALEYACDKCVVDLEYRAMDFMNKGKFTTFLKAVAEIGVGEVGVCAICRGNYVWGGHNPAPVVKSDDACCCTRCNNEIVIKERVKAFYAQIKDA